MNGATCSCAADGRKHTGRYVRLQDTVHASRQTIDTVCLQALGQRAHLLSSELVGCARSTAGERDAERDKLSPPEDDQEAKHQKYTHMAHVLIAVSQQGAALVLRVSIVARAGAAGTRC